MRRSTFSILLQPSAQWGYSRRQYPNRRNIVGKSEKYKFPGLDSYLKEISLPLTLLIIIICLIKWIFHKLL